MAFLKQRTSLFLLQKGNNFCSQKQKDKKGIIPKLGYKIKIRSNLNVMTSFHFQRNVHKKEEFHLMMILSLHVGIWKTQFSSSMYFQQYSTSVVLQFQDLRTCSFSRSQTFFAKRYCRWTIVMGRFQFYDTGRPTFGSLANTEGVL